MSAIFKKKSKISYAEQAGLVGYSDEELLKAIEASRAAVRAGQVTSARKAYAEFKKSKRTSPYAQVRSASFRPS